MTTHIPYNTTGMPALAEMDGPPYSYADVTMQVFPLRADPVQLANFVDGYLNIVPERVARFVPSSPYVLLILASYGEFGEVGGSQFGFHAETEIGFAVPLNWYRRDGSRLMLHDFGIVYPFMYPSDPYATFEGRTVFGWSNSLGWLEPTMSPWQRNPNAPQPVITLDSYVIPDLWSGGRTEQRTLLSIEHDSADYPFQWPPPIESPQNPINFIPNLAKSTFQTSKSILDTWTWWWQSGQLNNPRSTLSFLSSLLGTTISNLGQPDIKANVFTLKQFRDVEYQDEICFQSLLNSVMPIDSIKRFGFLGTTALLSPSGGYTIRLNNYELQPIIKILGLEVSTWEEGRQAEIHQPSQINRGTLGDSYFEPMETPGFTATIPPEKSVAVLKPEYPFWVELNMKYNASDVLCWRLRDTPWFAPYDDDITGLDERRRARDKRRGYVHLTTDTWQKNPYNTTLRTMVRNFKGPWAFSNCNLRVLPMLANPATMQDFLDSYLNTDSKTTGIEFKVWEEKVYMVVTEYGPMTSLTQDVGIWADRDVKILMPIKWYRDGDFMGYGAINPYTFSNSEIDIITRGETFGFPCLYSDIVAPEHTWLNKGDPRAPEPIVHVWTQFHPAVKMGTIAEKGVLIEIVQHDHEKDEDRSAASEALPETFEDILLGQEPLTLFSLKQFRAADLLTESSYQSIVCSWLHIDASPATGTSPAVGKSIQPTPITTPIDIRLHHNPVLPLVDLLGLEVESKKIGKPSQPGLAWRGAEVSVLHVKRPFWFNGSLSWGKGFNLCVRARGMPKWQIADIDKCTHQNFEPHRPESTPPGSPSRLEKAAEG